MDSKPLLLIVDCGNPSVIDYTIHAAKSNDRRIVVVTHPVIDENIEEAHDTCPIYHLISRNTKNFATMPLSRSLSSFWVKNTASEREK